MSHDQSPTRVRMVGSGDVAPGRRRHDLAPTIIDAGAAAAAPAASAPDGSRRTRVALLLLFLVACALAGVAVARRLA